MHDDHHSPVKPEKYIELRLEKMMQFYRSRLPVYARRRFVLRIALLLCTTMSAVLAYLDLSFIVIGVTALSGAVVSWSEFSETARKIERYTGALRGLKNIHSWWNVLTDVEKSGFENITHLVNTSEAIISNERSAWVSTADRLALKSGNDESVKKGGGEQGTSSGPDIV